MQQQSIELSKTVLSVGKQLETAAGKHRNDRKFSVKSACCDELRVKKAISMYQEFARVLKRKVRAVSEAVIERGTLEQQGAGVRGASSLRWYWIRNLSQS